MNGFQLRPYFSSEISSISFICFCLCLCIYIYFLVAFNLIHMLKIKRTIHNIWSHHNMCSLTVLLAFCTLCFHFALIFSNWIFYIKTIMNDVFTSYKHMKSIMSKLQQIWSISPWNCALYGQSNVEIRADDIIKWIHSKSFLHSMNMFAYHKY